MQKLKEKILELPDSLMVTKVHIETVNKHKEKHLIEFETSKDELITKEVEK